jgi:hypothetical protein
MRKAIIILFALATIAMSQDRWYPIRLEYANNGTEEIGMGSGIWWSKHADQIPLDAFGPTIALKAIVEGQNIRPGVQLGLEANALFLCARMQYGVYQTNGSSTMSLVNPQVGLTWLSLINFYVGYNKQVSGVTDREINEVNMSLCVNLPSYFFGNIQ